MSDVAKCWGLMWGHRKDSQIHLDLKRGQQTAGYLVPEIFLCLVSETVVETDLGWTWDHLRETRTAAMMVQGFCLESVREPMMDSQKAPMMDS